MKRWLWCVIALAGVRPCFAQYGLDTWTTEQGLPQNVVRAVQQARDGYLWVVTMDGLARFDGVRFTVFKRTTSAGISTNRFLAIHESGDDLWFGTEGGVVRYRDGAFTSYATDQGLPDLLVTALTGSEAGDLWVLSGEQIMRWHDGRFRPEPAGVGLRFVRSRWRSDVFFATDGVQVHRFEAGRMTTRTLPAAVQRRSDGFFAEDQADCLWMGLTGGGYAAVAPDGTVNEYHHAPSPEAIQAGKVGASDPHVIHRDRQGRAWTIALDHRMSPHLVVPTAAGVERVRFGTLHEDRDGNLWLATYNRGLRRVRPQAVSVLSSERGLGGRNVYPVLEDSRGAIWAGVWEHGLSRVEGGRITGFTRAQGLATMHPTALAEDPDGRLWVAGHEARNAGLQVLENGRFRSVTEPALPERTVVNVIHHDPRGGALWLGTNHGLVRYADGSSTVYTTAQGLAGDDVKVIVRDRDGSLWMGTTGGLSRVHGGRITSWRERDGLPGGTIRALHLDADGVLWIGSYDAGIARMKDGRFARITARDGLFDDGAFRILEAEGYLWISCNRGIYRVAKADATAFADGRQRAVAALALGRSDGLVNAEANGGTWPSGLVARDGKLWFPTQDGIAVVDPRAVSTETGPVATTIEALLVDRVPVPLGPAIAIGPERRTLELQYTALGFMRPEQRRFRYKMEGLDSDWEDAGVRRTAYYSYLPPGRYTFRVAASNARGVWSPEPASLVIDVRPPYWRTWWFGLLATAGVAAAGVAWYRRRIAGMERARAAQEAFSRALIASQEKERGRIASELHDSLGQSLIVICNWAALGSSVVAPASPGREELEEIGQAARRAVDEVRGIAHALGTHDLEELGLAESLGEMIERLRRSAPFEIVAELEPLDRALPREAETSLYRVAQEALNNVSRHAGASRVTVTLRQTPAGAVTLTISDNGRGFDQEAARAGFGLKDMAERVRLFAGEFALRSSPGSGTTVEVVMKGGADAPA